MNHTGIGHRGFRMASMAVAVAVSAFVMVLGRGIARHPGSDGCLHKQAVLGWHYSTARVIRMVVLVVGRGARSGCSGRSRICIPSRRGQRDGRRRFRRPLCRCFRGCGLKSTGPRDPGRRNNCMVVVVAGFCGGGV